MTPESLILTNIKLVSLPEICLQIQDLTESRTATADEIGRLVATDTALSARLLQLVNSAFFGISVQVETIPRAVNIIGMRELRNLAFAASATEIFSDIPDDVINMTDFWQHSAYCGIVARHLGKYCHILHNERLFTIGLLHDIGRLLLCTKLPNEVTRIMNIQHQTGEDILAIEEEVLGFNHAELGALLLANWNLPKNSCASVKYHHNPQDANDAYLESAVLYIANITADVAKNFQTDSYAEQRDPYGALLDSDINAHKIIDETMRRINPYALNLTKITQEQIMDAIQASAVGFSQVLDVIYPIAAREST